MSLQPCLQGKIEILVLATCDLSCTVQEDHQHLICSKYVFHELFITQQVQGEAVGRPATIEGRIGLAVQEGVITVINRGLCVC